MDDDEKSFLELFHEQQPNIFYLSIFVVLSILIFYFLSRWYFYGSFSLHENMKIILYLILQFSFIFYEFNETFKQCDIVQFSIFIIPISIFQFSLCSYIKLESIVASYERFSKEYNKKIERLIVAMILIFGSTECYSYIFNNKLNIESQAKAIFFIVDKSAILPVKKSIILALYHAEAMNLFSLLNHIAFMICIQLRLSSIFMLNLNWFLNSLHELFQTFLSIYLSENIIHAIPDALFHASFALFYFLKQKAFATLVEALKEIFLIFLNDEVDKTKEEENQNEAEHVVDEIINEIIEEDKKNQLINKDDEIIINTNEELNDDETNNNNNSQIINDDKDIIYDSQIINDENTRLDISDKSDDN